jgi:hypothetical protein
LDIHFGKKTNIDATLVWWKRTHLNTVKKQFGHIQRTTCLGMTGCMSTTPTAAMETFLGLPPLQLGVEKEARQNANRLHCSGHLKKIRICYFQDDNGRFSSFTGSF